MGTFFSFDSIGIIDKSIQNILYHPPQTPKKQIENLKLMPNTKVICLKNKSNIVSFCEVDYSLSHKDPIIIFSHGNATDIYHMYLFIRKISMELKKIVICWDYPSYGLSQGIPSEESCIDALDTVVNYYNTNKILLVGQSLGTGVVLSYCKKKSWSLPIILISPYKSIVQVPNENLCICESSFTKHGFISHDKLSQLSCPIKIYHGKDDTLISISHSIQLYEMIQNKILEPTYFDNCGHNDILNRINIKEWKIFLTMIPK
jgi:pimeloyl-ACP methyl ester carboxylesterase